MTLGTPMKSVWPIPVFSDNYVWVLERVGNPHVTIIDPGDTLPVATELTKRHLEIESILLTHHHNDHIGGVRNLARGLEIPVYGPTNISQVTHPVSDGDIIDLTGLDFSVTVIDVPGHTARHTAYFAEGLVFVGDTLFAGGCGRIFEGTPEQMYASLNMLASFPVETEIFCAHEYTLSNLHFAMQVEPGNANLVERYKETQRSRERDDATVPSTLDLELMTNPFLRCNEPEIVEAASRWARRPLSPGLDTFTEVRRWKDKF